ncbi:MAG: hypothetical protein Q8M98_00315 [Candidatus Cloacimonadaceae bacterium]|nr:hypothetical protein [Candidatus Cloacimonadaceae bacterium]MDP3113194.1 hypothetical protein [Candidatus Cloacimonadaceae bacterium]
MESEHSKLMHWWSLVRWFMVVVLFSIGLLHINFAETMVESMVFFTVFAGVVCLNLFFQLQSNVEKKWLKLFQVALDIVFATILVHLTGGLNSYFVWVYLIAVITASLTIPKVGGVFAGLIGSLCLMVLISMYQNGILQQTEPNALDATAAIIYILSYTGLFSAVAFISGYLNEYLHKYSRLEKELRECKQSTQQALADAGRAAVWKASLQRMMRVLEDIRHIKHDINTPLCVITLSLARVKRLGMELNNDGLQKSNNEITEAVNKISSILLRVDNLNQQMTQLAIEEEKHE